MTLLRTRLTTKPAGRAHRASALPGKQHLLGSRARSAALLATLAILTACKQASAPQGGDAASGAGSAMPVQTMTISSAPVAQHDEYVATIKSRSSATINPQVDGSLTSILARSGQRVKAGQVLMEIDPIKQRATLDSQTATEQQKLAVYQYNQTQMERQRKLFEAGITSRDAFEQAQQSFNNSKADYESSVASSRTQQRQLSYYHITAPFDGIVGDIPVHVGDYVSSSTLLTTVDENRNLEAYIYVPTEQASRLRLGLGVDILDSTGVVREHTAIDFLSPQVDNGLQSILAKAPVHSGAEMLRTAQLVKARVIWSTKAVPVVPVLAVSRLGGQAFVYVAQQESGKYVARQKAIDLGDTVGNNYAVLKGLADGEKVIVSGTQMLVDGAPVQPLAAAAQADATGAAPGSANGPAN